MWNALLAPLVITLAAAGAIGYLLLAPEPVTTASRILVLAAAGVITLIAILWSVARAASAARETHGDLSEVRAMIPRGSEGMQAAVERWQRGERPLPVDTPGRDPSELEMLVYELDRFRTEAVDAVVRSGTSASGASTHSADQRIGVFVNLARRLQSLVQREIQLLDDLEAEVEDPELLKGLFAVDHLATRIRRHAENLAVLGGAVTHRQWSRPVNTYVVLRSAVAEVEQYARVKLVRPIDGTLKGHAISDVIHLVAELVENATTFSNPNTQVLLRAQQVTAGIAIEVEDRGLGMPYEDLNRLNSMLSSPDQVDVNELLNDGRIGLYVVSTLARRHGIAVQLQNNIYGGIQAIMVMPHALLGESTPAASGAPESPRPAEQRPETPSAAQRQVAAEPAVHEMPQRPVGETVYHAPVSGAPTSPAPVSGAPVSSAPAGHGLAPVSGPPGEQPAVKRPRPYVGRNSGAGGVPTVSPDPRAAERPPVPAMSAVEPVSPAPGVQSRPQPSPRPPVPDVPTPELHFGGEMSSRLFESDNPSETTGVLPVTSVPPGEDTVPGAGEPPEPAGTTPRAEADDRRPRLPQRRRQTHLVSELREAPSQREAHLSEHNPGLMSAFQKGVSRAAPAAEDADVRVDGAT